MTTKKNILKKPKSKSITLADGKSYRLPPLDLNLLADLEDEFGCSLDKLTVELEKRMASNMRKLLWVLLRSDNPEMTLEQCGALVKTDMMTGVMDEITGVLNGDERHQDGVDQILYDIGGSD